jgi:hypothetical protein
MLCTYKNAQIHVYNTMYKFAYQLPEIWSGLMKINRDQWAAIAKFQIAYVFVDDANITKQQAIR